MGNEVDLEGLPTDPHEGGRGTAVERRVTGLHVFLGTVLAVGVVLGLSLLWSLFHPTYPLVGDVTPLGEGNWLFDCEVTGRGEAQADERFSGDNLAEMARVGDARLDRYYGTRVVVTVGVRRLLPGTIEPGTYTLYGTVQSVDMNEHRVRLTDCVFVPQ
jgi:hypothetical protein